jgi:hypothetical protein
MSSPVSRMRTGLAAAGDQETTGEVKTVAETRLIPEPCS